jgi:hypothetical protein
MSRKGHYLGGGTTVSGRDVGWFSKKNPRRADEGPGTVYVPERSAEEQREYAEFKARWMSESVKGESKLIARADLRRKRRRR